MIKGPFKDAAEILAHWAATVDAAVIDTWQRLVADPLQMRGVSLDRQYAVFLLLALLTILAGLVASVAAREWAMATMQALALAMWLRRSLEPRPWREAGPNPLRHMVVLTAVRLTLLFVALVTTEVIGMRWALSLPFDPELFWVYFVWAAILCASSETKPPRPKKITRVVPVAEWI